VIPCHWQQVQVITVGNVVWNAIGERFAYDPFILFDALTLDTDEVNALTRETSRFFDHWLSLLYKSFCGIG
jgi:hypothetical protein